MTTKLEIQDEHHHHNENRDEESQNKTLLVHSVNGSGVDLEHKTVLLTAVSFS